MRRQVYAGLAAYSLEFSEERGVMQPLKTYVEMLQSEEDPAARAACQSLVVQALQYEYANRRRYMLSGPKPTGK